MDSNVKTIDKLEELHKEKTAIRDKYRAMEITTEEYQEKMEEIYSKIDQIKNAKPEQMKEESAFWM